MRRRAMGEKITVAQNLFEPEPTARWSAADRSRATPTRTA
jgi:hypothetical protein